MTILWQGLKVTFGLFLILGLLFASGVFSVLLYAKFTDKEAVLLGNTTVLPAASVPASSSSAPASTPKPEHIKSAMIDTPVIRQNPELPAGCEVTSLAMLLQFHGLSKSKMELAAEMPKDETPISLNSDGSIRYWGNPKSGFVGDVTRKGRGFGIYAAGLLPLLRQYVPNSVDLTEQPFEQYEQQIAKGVPVIVWTTIDYTVPASWVSWDTSAGPIQTTFMEHAVLLVGFDESSVYLNDPLSGKKSAKVDKESFKKSWEAMGKQGLTFTK